MIIIVFTSKGVYKANPKHVQKYAGGVTRRDGPPAAKEDPLRSIVETDATVRSVLKEFDADLRGAYASVASAGRDRSATMAPSQASMRGKLRGFMAHVGGGGPSTMNNS